MDGSGTAHIASCGVGGLIYSQIDAGGSLVLQQTIVSGPLNVPGNSCDIALGRGGAPIIAFLDNAKALVVARVPEADIVLTSKSVTPTTVSGGRPVSGSISGNWWTEPGSEGALWYVVAGFRDSSGSWVGGEPVPVSGMQGVTLPLYPGQSFADAQFSGLTAPIAPGPYTVWIQMVPVTSLPGAINAFKAQTATTEKQYHKQVGDVTVRPLGDVDGDGHVDVVDLLYFVDAFGTQARSANWNAACDLNGDGFVDILDRRIFLKAYGSHPGDPNYNPACDFNGDGNIDSVDLGILDAAMYAYIGDPNYSAACDFNDDGWVDVVDLLVLVENFGL
jgi:hypothetical protein